VRRHLLVTNDFPPKVGGIQRYLWELWRRLDPESFVVLTASSHPDASSFDAEQAAAGVQIVRVPQHVLYFPTGSVVHQVRSIAAEHGADAVVLDPVLPLGLAGPRVGLPYAVVLHGAEAAAPARVAGTRALMARVLQRASLAIAAGEYAAVDARRAAGPRMCPVVNVPPGVDCDRFVPLVAKERAAARRRLGLPAEGPLVVSVSRLVPRKGMDVLIEASARLAASLPTLCVAIGGAGRDRARLERLVAERGAPVRLLGSVADDDLPALLGAADVFVMACRDRWFGLEQEGFGIVFVEAAAAGVPAVAGESGGAAEAVDDGVTGIVVARPQNPGDVALGIRRLLFDSRRRRQMGRAARRRAEASFDYGLLASRLAEALDELASPTASEGVVGTGGR